MRHLQYTHMWRFIDTGIADGAWNMAVDEALLEGFREGDSAILRVYGWENALSLGRFSPLNQTIDVQRLEAGRISCVRRITGGGVLVHGGDLSYSLIVPRNSAREVGVKEYYRILCRFLIRLYEALGHQPRFAEKSGTLLSRGDVCLAGNEAYDIVIGGKKMGGNAQRHARHALLQQGTIPIRFDRALFDPLFRHDSGLERAASLEGLGSAMDYATLAARVREAFVETYGAELMDDTLSESEKERAQELMELKYTQERWNLHGIS